MRDFRKVVLPDTVPGNLYLHSMPGRFTNLADDWTQIRRLAIRAIVCLTPEEEIRSMSRDYADALAAGQAPSDVWTLPVPDFAGPPDDVEFVRLAQRVALSLKGGEAILVHCGAGIGRTGTFAVGVLIALGVDAANAVDLVWQAGSGPERASQRAALTRLAQRLAH